VAGEAWLAACARAGQKVDGHGPPPPLDSLITNFFATDLADEAVRRGPTYESKIRQHIEDYVAEAFDGVEDITPDAWRSHAHELHADGLSWRTIQNITVSARHLLTFAKRAGVIDRVPEIEAPAQRDVVAEAAPRRALTEAERDALLGYFREHDPFAWRAYRLMFWTALRKSEVEKLCGRWLAPRPGWIVFPAGRTKSGKRGQKAQLLAPAQVAVDEQRAARGTIDPDAPIFGPINFEIVFWRAVKELGIDEFGLTAHHVARHSCITHAAERGASFKALMEMGRWSSPQVAMDYLHLDGNSAWDVLATAVGP